MYSIGNAEAMDISVYKEYHASAYLLLPGDKKEQKLHNFNHFGVFRLASAFPMLYPTREKFTALFERNGLQFNFPKLLTYGGRQPALREQAGKG